MTRTVVIGVSTTGLNFKARKKADRDRLVEVAAIELIDGRKTGVEFHHYLDPQRVIPKKATDLHGITNDSVKDCPTFAEIKTAFLDFIKTADVIVMHTPFVLQALHCEFKQLGRKEESNYKTIKAEHKIEYTCQFGRELEPKLKGGHGLDNLCKEFGIRTPETVHASKGALRDANRVADLYLLLQERLEVKPDEAEIKAAAKALVAMSKADASPAFFATTNQEAVTHRYHTRSRGPVPEA